MSEKNRLRPEGAREKPEERSDQKPEGEGHRLPATCEDKNPESTEVHEKPEGLG